LTNKTSKLLVECNQIIDPLPW